MKAILLFFVLAGLVAEAQVITPQPSPAGSVSTVVGLVDIKIEYSRPKAKGRKIFGSTPEHVVPFDKMWRTGANNGTRITFGDDVKVGSTDVPKGTYLLLTIPGASEWTMVLYKDVSLGGNVDGYDKTKDAARVIAKSEKLTEKVETMTFQITDVAENSKTANIQLSWEFTSVKIPITVDFDKKVMTSIEASTKLNPNYLYSAANYYLENGKDLKQALEWATTAAAARPDAYWIWYTKARIQAALGDKKGAMESSNASKNAAIKDKDDAYVKMNDELMKGLK